MQALLTATGERGRKIAEESNTGSNIKVAKSSVFNRKTEKVGSFIIVCKLYLRMKMRGILVEK